MMCVTRWPNVICGGVGLKENLSAGMVSTAACRFLACRGSISLITVVTGFFFCASSAGQSAHNNRHTQKCFMEKASRNMQQGYPGSRKSVTCGVVSIWPQAAAIVADQSAATPQFIDHRTR